MTSEKMFCPLQNADCRSDCALFVNPDDMNEVVRNKLASVGVINRDSGSCSLKNLALCLNRQVFEQVSNFLR